MMAENPSDLGWFFFPLLNTAQKISLLLKKLQMSYAEPQGTKSFYHDFCRSLSCKHIIGGQKEKIRLFNVEMNINE